MARMKTKPFTKTVGTFYFNVKTRDMNITIHRTSLENAKQAFMVYIRQGKQCEWLGKWNGKKFIPVDTSLVMA